MNIESILSKLQGERDRLQRAIDALGDMGASVIAVDANPVGICRQRLVGGSGWQ